MEVKNIRGEFKINLAGQERTMKCNFDAIERLETSVLGKSIVQTMVEATQGKFFMRDVVSVIHTGLLANNDTRLSKSQIGEALLNEGTTKGFEVFLSYLNYAVMGGVEAKESKPGEEESQ